MTSTQADLFAQDATERNTLSEPRRMMIRARLEAALSKLEASSRFPWEDPLDAVHDENRFQHDTELLGEEGQASWARFDKVMDRLYAEQSSVVKGEEDTLS